MSPKEDLRKFLGNLAGIAALGATFLKGDRKDVSLENITNQNPSIPEIPPYNLPVPSSIVKPYQAYESPYGGLVVIVGNYQIGSAFDSPAFKASIDKFGKWMTDHELKVAIALEDRVRETRKHLGPRVYSGLDSHSHIVMNFEIALENFIASNVRPDYVTSLVTIGIDIGEDNKKVIQKQEKWEEAVISFNEPLRIQKERELLTAIHEVLYHNPNKKEEPSVLEYLTKIVKRTGIKGSERKKLMEDIVDAVRLMGHHTRHPWRAYPLSMAFQIDKRGHERMAIAIARIGGKIADRTSNNLDIRPAFSYEEFMELQRAHSENPTIAGYKLGQFLRERYGEFRLGRYMPLAVRVGNGVNNISILHPLNNTLNQISGQIRHGTREEELLRWVNYSKSRMIQSALGLANSANTWYELILPQDAIQTVNGKIERRRRSNYYNAETPDGFFRDWLGYDIAGRSFIESFDTSPQKRAETYEASRDLAEVLPMFGMFSKRGHRDDYGRPILVTDHGIKFDPTRHEHFTLDGMEAALKKIEGDNYRNMARRWLPEKYMVEVNGNGKNAAVQLPLF